MTENTIPEIWIEIVKEKFVNGKPNGWLQGWDSERFSRELKRMSGGFEFINRTSFDYDCCNSYYLYYPSPKSETYEKLTVDISFIVDAYQLFWTQYFNYGKKGKVIQIHTFKKGQILEAKIREFLERKGFKECLSEWSEIEISGVKLELGNENVTLGKCLFIDYDS